MIMSTHGVVTSGHYLATHIGIDVLRRGGNAMDAAAAVGFALSVLMPHQNGIGGEVPMLIRRAADGKVHAISGHGIAPRAATIARFRREGLDVIPGDGFLPAVVPPAVASWILALGEFGTMRLSEVLAPAVELAGRGFPMYDALHGSIAGSAERFRQEWPSSAEVFTPGGEVPAIGAIWRQPDWAATFSRLIVAEKRFRKREDGLRAAYDEFYRGRIAETIVSFSQTHPVRDATGKAHAGLLTMEDFNEFQARIEEPVQTSYRDVRIFKCSSWTQGPVLLQALNLLEGFDVAAMGHNSPDYVHTVVECMKLAFADREFYYGDPGFVDVPFGMLLSKAYARERRRLVDAANASLELRPGGRPPVKAESITDVNRAFASETGGHSADTTKL